jgi:hypothetical protein
VEGNNEQEREHLQFLKSQQWQIAAYTVALNGALIAYYEQLKNPAQWERVVLGILGIFLFVFHLLIQINVHKGMTKSRKALAPNGVNGVPAYGTWKYSVWYCLLFAFGSLIATAGLVWFVLRDWPQ